MLSLNSISFTHEGAVNPLFDRINITFAVGWTGIVGANGTGKTTLLRLACGELDPHTGSIHRPRLSIYCPQRTDHPPEGLTQFIESLDPSACELRGRIGIERDWHARWDTLSHGERKRAQIAVALWREPDVLAVDEPTNHIDTDAMDLLARALSGFRGVGMLVSHDRELLDALCRQCAFIEPPNVTMRPGSYTEATRQAQLEDQHIRDEYEQAKTAVEKLRREAIRRHEEASRADRRRSKRHIDPKDHDAKGRIDAARISGVDGKAGRLASQLDGRVRMAESRLGEFEIKRRYQTSFWLSGSRSPRNTLFSLPAGSLELGADRWLAFPELAMQPDSRIAITGPNGAGKSTLVRHVISRLNLPADKVIYLPQEISMEQSRRVMQEVNSLPNAQLGTVMTIVSCLGSRPERLVGSDESSPGEIRKVLLALGVSLAPHLIVMDEPTNHLDLPAIECLEEALSECPCGLLLVSHDFRFLSRLATIRWRLAPDAVGFRLSVTDMSEGR